MPETLEWRVVWQREDCRPKRKVFAREQSARRFLLILGPEPWLAYGKAPEDLFCCQGGYECGCNGITVKEKSDAARAKMPALLYVRLESRPVGKWEEVSRG